MKFPPPYTWFTKPPYEKPDRENVFVIWLVYAAVVGFGASLFLPVLRAIYDWVMGNGEWLFIMSGIAFAFWGLKRFVWRLGDF